MNSRRSFLKIAGLSTLAGITLPQLAKSAFKEAAGKQVRINTGDIILFQGDSITDAGRSKKVVLPNTTTGMGSGYAMLSASKLLLKHPAKNLTFFNRGISGDKVFQLRDRWEAECLQLKPSVLSILIGVNDYWATNKHAYTGTIETYHNDFKALLELTFKSLPEVKVIIGEPFALRGVKEVDDSWYPEFNKFRQVARDLSDQFNTGFIPYQSIFDKATQVKPGSYWTTDGVHPSLAGAALMSNAWLEAVR